MKWVTSFSIQISISQQTLVCPLSQFDKRFSQRSSTILALAHNALSAVRGEPMSLPSNTPRSGSSLVVQLGYSAKEVFGGAT